MVMIFPGAARLTGLDRRHVKSRVGVGRHRLDRLWNRPRRVRRRALQVQRQRGRPLRPGSRDALAVGAHLAFVLASDQVKREGERAVLKRCLCRCQRLPALIDAVKGRLVAAFIVLRDLDLDAQILVRLLDMKRPLPDARNSRRRGRSCRGRRRRRRTLRRGRGILGPHCVSLNRHGEYHGPDCKPGQRSSIQSHTAPRSFRVHCGDSTSAFEATITKHANCFFPGREKNTPAKRLYVRNVSAVPQSLSPA